MPEMSNQDKVRLARGVLGDVEPHDILNPSFRLEDQDMAEYVEPVVIGPPPYASPDASTNNNRLVAVDLHPNSPDIAEDYGLDVMHSEGASAESPLTSGEQPTFSSSDRDEWTQDDWKKAAEHYDLPKSGSKAALRERVEAREAQIEEDQSMTAEDWKDEIDSAEYADDLTELKTRYQQSGASYSTVEDAFSSKEADLAGDNGEEK